MTRININQVNLNYESAGQGDAIVFLHGFTGSHEDWRYQMAAVKDRFWGIALDLRGHGKSDAPTGEDDYSIYLNCEDVRGLLKELGISRCCLVGHSMGGFTAVQFAIDHPDMLWGLVLVDTSSGEWDTVPGYAELRAKLDDLARTQGLEAAFAYDAENNPVRIERFKVQPEQREISRRKTLSTAVDAYIYVPRSFGKWQSVTARLGEIKVPTIIFRGENDAGFVRPSDVMKEGIAGSELVVVPDAYHNPHEENQDYFNDYFLKFLSRIRP
ncbi:MAG: alpha/beta fold hydrolase [Deltaproteobacteria bacterium]|nr:alpha/beta fold hydrolase [Deltaproteobacteria bacterium]